MLFENNLSVWTKRFVLDKIDLSSSFPVLLPIVGLLLALACWLALPQPIPGIPYNASAARSIFGDIPSMLLHMSRNRGDFVTYISETMETLDSPLVQVFMRPLKLGGNKPMLVLADARETQDILLRRSREFDRSPSMGDLVWGIAPDHHIHRRTEDAGFKAQRRLIQDLMTPAFLRGIAGPVIHRSTQVLIDLWRVKCRAAEGRPFEAALDLSYAVMDAITAFAFGETFRAQHSTTKPALEALEAFLRIEAEAERDSSVCKKGGVEEPVQFPRGSVDEVLQAILDLTETIGELQGNPLPKLMWMYVLRKPRISRARCIKEACIRNELESAASRVETAAGVGSAVDHMVLREKALAEKQKRKPDYLSRAMMDEIFGFVFAGHETTSTTLSWAVKFLADHTVVQTRLRHALQSSFGATGPTFEAISSMRLPYLDAVLEEVLRRAATAPLVDRIALADTEILGCRVPKGTVVTFLSNGPSMLRPPFPVDETRRSPTSQARSDMNKSWDPRDIATFKPERWLVPMATGQDTSDLAADVEFDGAAGPQLAFGLGPRGCYGKKLAYLQMRIVLSLVVYNFELLPCPSHLSGYQAELVGVEKPKQCYVVLRETDTQYTKL
ncbi:cytochrome P450 monooxygenase [Xylaria digitata]|nr:cytochrome P450 monooxygenase [Xylaria digitata]